MFKRGLLEYPDGNLLYIEKKKYMDHKLHFLISQEQNMILIFLKESLPVRLMRATKSF